MPTYYAQREIHHDGQVIRAGEALPEDFPADSLKKLVADGSAGPEEEPAQTKITREKKTKSPGGGPKAAPPAAAK